MSNTRHLELHNPLLETKRYRLVIVNFPDSFCGIPFAARLFDTALQFGFPEFHNEYHKLMMKQNVSFVAWYFEQSGAKGGYAQVKSSTTIQRFIDVFNDRIANNYGDDELLM